MKPEKERSIPLQTSQPIWLVEKIREAARKANRSLSEEIRQAALLPAYGKKDVLEDKQKTGKMQKSDRRVEPLARLLCEQWDDEWSLGKKLHTINAKSILALIDGFK